MYDHIKSILKKVVPKQFLYTYEEIIRLPYAVLYAGKKQQCTVCNHTVRKFIATTTQDQRCPFCGSLSRTRRLYKLLRDEYILTGNVLHFSPSRCLYRRLKKVKNISYYSSDFENEFMADYRFDITDIAAAASFDYIICYHILEHIMDDIKAMKELYRVLKPRGTLFVQTPFKEGETYENSQIVSPEDRLKHFGQEDHVRIYAVKDLEERLKLNNFTTIKVKSLFKNPAS